MERANDSCRSRIQPAKWRATPKSVVAAKTIVTVAPSRPRVSRSRVICRIEPSVPLEGKPAPERWFREDALLDFPVAYCGLCALGN
jgi:hypothetical protein